MTAAIDVSGLVVRRGGKIVLDHLDLVVPEGTVTGLLGPNGSGKTTLLRSIVGAQRITAGTVRVLGRPAGHPALRAEIGYTTQAPSVYGDLTAAENIHYRATLHHAPRSTVDDILTAVGLAEEAHRLVRAMSGGQVNRVSLACALATLSGMLAEFNTGSVDGAGGRLVSYDERTVDFGLAVVVPLHAGAGYVGWSPGLGDELGFVPTDLHTLQSTVRPNIFAIGDAASIPTSKAGSVTHFEGEVLVRNVRQHLAGKPLDASFDGHTNCFIESGFGKALLIDFNYDTEPLPGHFPAGVGLPLLRESHLNHLGKLMFAWLYWHVLLPGRGVPGVPATMPRAGKRFPTVTGG